METPELIIFDCDGVLVDSEKIAAEVFAALLEEHFGLSFSLEEMYRNFVGRSTEQCIDLVGSMLGYRPSDDLAELSDRAINSALRERVVPVEGVEPLLESLNLPFCVASNGTHEKMATTLGRTGLDRFFEGKRFSFTDVDRGKPHPDLFLYAARKMGGIDPSHCLVVEDSPTGIKAGVAAGMTVFGYTELVDASLLVESGAHCTFNHMADLVETIRSFRHSTVDR